MSSLFADRLGHWAGVVLTVGALTFTAEASYGQSAPDTVGACGNGPPSASVQQALASLRVIDGATVALRSAKIHVVFHTIYNTGSAAFVIGATSWRALQTQIDVLNKDYAGSGITFSWNFLETTLNGNDDWFTMCAGDQFERAAKQALATDPVHNLNVYICSPHATPNGTCPAPAVGGFTQPPGRFPINGSDGFMNGVALEWEQLADGVDAKNGDGHTLTHEVGHFLGLSHPFDFGCNDNTLAAPDVPFEANPSGSCVAMRHTCPNQACWDPINNFMDYSPDACRNNFTPGQIDRMWATLDADWPDLGQSSGDYPVQLRVTPTECAPGVGTAFNVGGRGFESGANVDVYLQKPGKSKARVATVRAGGDGTLSWSLSPDCTYPIGNSYVSCQEQPTHHWTNVVTLGVLPSVSCGVPPLTVAPVGGGPKGTTTYTFSSNGCTPNGAITLTIGNYESGVIVHTDVADAYGAFVFTDKPGCEHAIGDVPAVLTDETTGRSSAPVFEHIQASSSCGPLQLSVSPTSAQQNTAFTVSGSGFTPGGAVSRYVMLPRQVWQRIDNVTADASGVVSWTFTPDCNHPVGDTQVYAVDLATVRTSPTITEAVTQSPGCNGLTLAVDPVAGAQTQVTFTVTGSHFTPSGVVHRYAQLPSGPWQQISDLRADAAGNLSWRFAPDCTQPVGDTHLYAVDAATSQQSPTITETVTAGSTCTNPTLEVTPPTGAQLSVTFSVTGQHYTANGVVNRWAQLPGQAWAQISDVQADAGGNVAWTFQPNCSQPLGDTHLYAIDAASKHQSPTITERVTAGVACSPLTLLVSPAAGAQGVVTFHVSGGHYTPNGAVNRWVQLPGQAWARITDVAADGAGNVSWDFAPSCSQPLGDTHLYAVDAATGWQSSSITETVTAGPSCVQVTLTSSPASGAQTQVTFSVSGTHYTPNGVVHRYAQLQGQAWAAISDLAADGSGNLVWTFVPSCDQPVGTTTLYAVDAATGRQSPTISQTTTAWPACGALTLTNSPPSGARTRVTFTVSGSHFTPNGMVHRYAQLPGQGWAQISDVTADGTGNVSWAFAPDCSQPVGTTYLYAVDAATGRQSPTVSQTTTDYYACSGVSLSSSPPSGARTQVTYNVSGGNYTANGVVHRYAQLPGQGWAQISDVTADGAGNVSWAFAPDCSQPVGTTYLYAVDAATGRQSPTVSQTTTDYYACSGVSLSSSPPSGARTQVTYNVSGGDYTANGVVHRYAQLPGQGWAQISDVTADGAGNVSWAFAPDCSQPVGTTYLYAVDAATGRQSPTVSQTTTDYYACSGVTLSSSPASGARTQVTFSVNGGNYTANGVVHRYAQLPGQGWAQISDVTANGSGGLSWTFAPDCSQPVGTTYLYAVDAATGRQSPTVAQTTTDYYACYGVTLSSSPASGARTQVTFSVSGGNYTAGGVVHRYAQLPGQGWAQISDVSADGSGNLSWAFAPDCSQPVGTTYLYAVDAATGRQSPTVAQTTTDYYACSGVTLSSSPASGARTQVTFSVNGGNYTAGGVVHRYAQLPGQGWAQISDVTANGSGGLSWTFAPDCSQPVGTTYLYAVDAATGRQSPTVAQTTTDYYACYGVTLSSSPASGARTQVTFSVSGGNYTAGGVVHRYAQLPGQGWAQISDVSADGSGNLSWAFAPDCSQPLGTTYLYAVDAATGRQSPTVAQTTTDYYACYGVTLSSSPASGQQTKVTFTVSGGNYTANGVVHRYAQLPGQAWAQISDVTANASGNVGWTFAPTCSQPVGTTNLYAVDAATGRQSNTISQTTTHYSGCALAFQPDSVIVARLSRTPGTITIQPNPTRGTALIAFMMPKPGPASLSIFNLAGQKLRGYVLENVGTGVTAVQWDGTADDGRKVPPGVYFVRLARNNEVADRRIVVFH